MVKWQWRHRILTCVSRTSTSWRCMQSLIGRGLPGRGAHVGEKLATSLQACANFRDGFSCAFTVRKGRNSQAPEKTGGFLALHRSTPPMTAGYCHDDRTVGTRRGTELAEWYMAQQR